MEWGQIVPYIIEFMAIAIASWVARSIDKMRSSVEELNVQIAKVVTRQNDHDRRIARLEDHQQ